MSSSCRPDDLNIDIDFFNENGFLVIPNFFSLDNLESLRNEMNLLIDNYDMSTLATFETGKQKQVNEDEYFLSSGDKISFFLESTSIDEENGQLLVPKREAFNKVAHALHDCNPIFEKLSYHPSLYQITKKLGFKKPQICQSMFIFKSPKIGGEVFPHQDTTFVQTIPATCIGTWVSLDDANEENGCMYFVPGSHKAKVERFFNLNEQCDSCSFNIPGYKYDISKAIPVPVTAGSLVLLHGAVVHYSGHNNSDKRRNAYSMHIIDGIAEYPKTNWLRRREDFPFRDFEMVSKGLYREEELEPEEEKAEEEEEEEEEKKTVLEQKE